MESVCSVTVNNTVPGKTVVLESSGQSRDCFLIMEASTKKILGKLHYPEDSPYRLELFNGKGGFMVVLTSPKGIKYFGLPGSTIAVQGVSIELEGSPITSNPSKKESPRLPAKPQHHTAQATILGAGLATRFERVSGDSTQYSKPAVPLVGEQSVIELIANNLAANGFSKLIVNTYFKPVSLKASLAKSQAETIQYIDESEPSGTAGGLQKMLLDPQYTGLLNQSEPLLVVQGDSVTDADFSELMEQHVKQKALVTLGCQLIDDKDVDKFGIIVTDKSGADGQSGRITGFQEKPSPAEAKSNLGNTGFYIFSPEAYPLIVKAYQALLAQAQELAKRNGDPVPSFVLFDFANDLFPKILEATQNNPSFGPFWAQTVSGYWSDIGNPSQYLESIHDVYAGKVNVTLPALAEDYYQNGIVYWQGAKTIAEQENAELTGNVVVASPFSE